MTVVLGLLAALCTF